MNGDASKVANNQRKLGFGMMRLPKVDGGKSNPIDEKLTAAMVEQFIGAGGYYFDTARNYDMGKSEELVGELVVQRYPRDSIWITSKNPFFVTADASDFQVFLQASLSACKLDYFDLYLVHFVSPSTMQKANELDIWGFVQKVKERGLAKHLGFSYHGDAEHLEQILEAQQSWVEYVQIQLNYADWYGTNEVGRKCYEVVRKYDKQVIVMEPLKGGGLADMAAHLSQPVTAQGGNLADYGLRFLFDLPGISTILSGMGTQTQLRENLQTFAQYQPLSETQKAALAQVTANLEAVEKTGCTACGYCLKDCSQQIRIPFFLAVLDNYRVYSSMSQSQHEYNVASGRLRGTANPQPSDCIKCMACEKNCPQNLKITSLLEEINTLFG